eukprot:93117_1
MSGYESHSQPQTQQIYQSQPQNQKRQSDSSRTSYLSENQIGNNIESEKSKLANHKQISEAQPPSVDNVGSLKSLVDCAKQQIGIKQSHTVLDEPDSALRKSMDALKMGNLGSSSSRDSADEKLTDEVVRPYTQEQIMSDCKLPESRDEQNFQVSDAQLRDPSRDRGDNVKSESRENVGSQRQSRSQSKSQSQSKSRPQSRNRRHQNRSNSDEKLPEFPGLGFDDFESRSSSASHSRKSSDLSSDRSNEQATDEKDSHRNHDLRPASDHASGLSAADHASGLSAADHASGLSAADHDLGPASDNSSGLSAADKEAFQALDTQIVSAKRQQELLCERARLKEARRRQKADISESKNGDRRAKERPARRGSGEQDWSNDGVPLKQIKDVEDDAQLLIDDGSLDEAETNNLLEMIDKMNIGKIKYIHVRHFIDSTRERIKKARKSRVNHERRADGADKRDSRESANTCNSERGSVRKRHSPSNPVSNGSRFDQKTTFPNKQDINDDRNGRGGQRRDTAPRNDNSNWEPRKKFPNDRQNSQSRSVSFSNRRDLPAPNESHENRSNNRSFGPQDSRYAGNSEFQEGNRNHYDNRNPDFRGPKNYNQNRYNKRYDKSQPRNHDPGFAGQQQTDVSKNSTFEGLNDYQASGGPPNRMNGRQNGFHKNQRGQQYYSDRRGNNRQNQNNMYDNRQSGQRPQSNQHSLREQESDFPPTHPERTPPRRIDRTVSDRLIRNHLGDSRRRRNSVSNNRSNLNRKNSSGRQAKGDESVRLAWSCSQCSFDNAAKDDICGLCDIPKP